MENLNGILLIGLIIVAVIVICIWCRDSNGRGRGKKRGDRGDGGHGKAKCTDPSIRPGAPTDLVVSSDEAFQVAVSFAAPDCEVDHYCVYVKYLDACPTPVNASRKKVSSHGHGHGCGCHACSPSPVVYVPESPDVSCGCGPDNYDRVIQVSGGDRRVVITDLRQVAACITVTAINGCGRESKTSNCANVCINSDCAIYPCIVQDDCRGINLKWQRVGCANAIRIYYDGTLMFEVPGDASGVEGLPAADVSAVDITVRAVNEGGESEDYAVSTTCPTHSSYGCSRCSHSPCSCSH